MLGLLNLLEPYDFQSSGCLDSDLNVHRFVEASKFAFGARSEVCDPAFASDSGRFDEFYSKSWADAIRPTLTDVSRRRKSPSVALIAPQNMTHTYDYYGLKHDTPIDKGTMHLSVLDQWGGAISMTSTVSGPFNIGPFPQKMMTPRSTGYGGARLWIRTQASSSITSRVSWPRFEFADLSVTDDFAVPGAADQFGLQPSPWNYPAPGKK